jgi:hypothetical protein
MFPGAATLQAHYRIRYPRSPDAGDPGVGLGVYATVLHGYGMLERLESLVDARWDRAGLALEASRLPRRIRKSDL